MDKGYYDNIDQYRLLEHLSAYIKDRAMLNLLWQAMRRTVTWGGLYRSASAGSRGCPLRPLLARSSSMNSTPAWSGQACTMCRGGAW